MVGKSGWIFKTNQQTQNDMTHLLQTTCGVFSLARRICSIVENENVTKKRVKELKKKTLLEQKIP